MALAWEAVPVAHKKIAHHARGAEPTTSDRIEEIDALVPDWLSVPEAAELQHLPLSRVRQQIEDRELVAVRRGRNNAVSIPAAFVTPDGPLPQLRGTVTVLVDGGMQDDDLIVWLFTPDDSLGDTPMGQLLAGRKTEVRRRAMESAF